MMEILPLLKACGAGLAVAAPVGPMTRRRIDGMSGTVLAFFGAAELMRAA